MGATVCYGRDTRRVSPSAEGNRMEQEASNTAANREIFPGGSKGSKPFAFGMAAEELGHEKVCEHVSLEPSRAKSGLRRRDGGGQPAARNCDLLAAARCARQQR